MDPESFDRWRPTLTKQFFVVDWEREDLNTTKSRPLLTHKRNAIGGLTLNAGLVFQGIRTSIVKKPYIFVIFVLPSGSTHVGSQVIIDPTLLFFVTITTNFFFVF